MGGREGQGMNSAKEVEGASPNKQQCAFPKEKTLPRVKVADTPLR